MKFFGKVIGMFKSLKLKNMLQYNLFNDSHKEGDLFTKDGKQYEVKRGESGKTRVHRADEQINMFEPKKEKPKLTLRTKINKPAEHFNMLKPKGSRAGKQAVEEPEHIHSKTTEMYDKKQGRKYSKEEAEKILNEYMEEVAEMQERGEINSKKKRSKIYQKRVELGLHEVAPIPVSNTKEEKNEKYSIEITSEYNLGNPHVYDNYWNLDDAVKDLHKVHEYIEDKEKEKHTAYIVKYKRNEDEDGDEDGFIRDNDWDDDKYVKTYGGINEKTNEILREVEDEFGGKYSEINLGSNKEGEAVTLELRIADHSGNDGNTNYNSVNKVLSIVIANKDFTERFKKSEYSIPDEYYFDENYSATKIINFINKKIKELKHSVI
jgi:hypothetical protein